MSRCWATVKAPSPPVVAFELRILDKAGQPKEDTGLLRVDIPPAGGPVLPVVGRIPTASLAPGSYVVEIKARDDAGKESQRLANIEIE